jgi:hypothetical protein
MPNEANAKMQLLYHMITDFVTVYKNSITGKFDSKRNTSQNPHEKKISGGARIKLCFHSLYKEFARDYCATADYSDADIEQAIMQHEGDTIPGFPSVDVFVYLIQPELEKLREPALDCINDVYGLLEGLASETVNRIF